MALFKEIILPQFPHKDKIKIINDDPVAYLKKVNDGDYDYCFADLWSWDESDSIYITTKIFCKKFQKMTVEYWLESDFLQTLISAFSEVIEIQYAEETGEELEFDSDYTEYEQFVVDFIENTLADYVIDDTDAISTLTTPEKLSQFLAK